MAYITRLDNSPLGWDRDKRVNLAGAILSKNVILGRETLPLHIRKKRKIGQGNPAPTHTQDLTKMPQLGDGGLFLLLFTPIGFPVAFGDGEKILIKFYIAARSPTTPEFL